MLSARSAAPDPASACMARSRELPLVAVRPGRPNSADQNPARAWLVGPDHHVLDHRQAAEQADALQRAGDAEARPAGAAADPVSSRPPKRIVPEWGLTKPHRTLSNVVLPAPFGPMMPVTCR